MNAGSDRYNFLIFIQRHKRLEESNSNFLVILSCHFVIFCICFRELLVLDVFLHKLIVALRTNLQWYMPIKFHRLIYNICYTAINFVRISSLLCRISEFNNFWRLVSWHNCNFAVKLFNGGLDTHNSVAFILYFQSSGIYFQLIHFELIMKRLAFWMILKSDNKNFNAFNTYF